MGAKKLTLDELLDESGDKLSRFVGILVLGGFQKEYDAEIIRLRKGKPAKKFMTLNEYNKIKTKYLEG